MSSRAAFFMFLFVTAGCALNRPPAPYVYSEPVTIALKMFEPTNGHYAATFSITNVSTEPLWFEGWRMNDPVYYLEWKSRAYLVPMPVNGYDDAGGLRGWRLATGQGTTFSIMLERRPDTLEPFRVGVEVWPDGDYHQVPHWICWSETVTP